MFGVTEVITGTTDAFTVIVTVALEESIPSEAVRLRRYVPSALKLAVVAGKLALPKMTVPGPLTTLQLAVRTRGEGNPSSEIMPDKIAGVGKETV